jgi:hypothetical protein
LLAAEVLVHGGSGDPGTAGDVLQAGALEAGSANELTGALHDPLSGLSAP